MTTPNPVEKKFSLRVLIDRKRNKVLFAEADSDFVDVLFSFMTLPLGTIVRLLDKHFGPQGEAMGSLNTMYNSLRKLNSTSFWTEEAKLMLLNPRNPSETECQKLKLNIDDSEPAKYFICEDWECIKKYGYNVTVSTYNISRCHCGRFMNREIGFNTSNVQVASSKEGVFTTDRLTFIIRDDLQVMTNLAGSSIELLNSLGIKNMTELEAKICILGLKEIISLLKWSIVSKTPLSDVFLHNKPLKSEIFCPVLSQASKNTTANSRKMVLKVMVHKSTKKVVFAQAEEDFIDLLFSLLTIPLGSVVSLLGGNSSPGSIANLYKSISCLDTDRYLKSQDIRKMLLFPKLPPQYLCKNHIFYLSEKSFPQLIYNSFFESQKHRVYLSHRKHRVYVSHRSPNQTLSSSGNTFTRSVTFKDLKGGKEGFVRGPAMFMVRDDLKVTPMSSISSIFFLNKLGIPFCDVQELSLDIGTEEALGILGASLSSSSALTNGLNLTSKEPPKQEN